MKRLLLVVSILCICIPALANDAAIRGVGGSVAPMDEHPSVRMVSEKVDAKVGWDTAKVRCEFVFKNEGPATTVKIGFPESAGGEVGPIKKSDMKNFRSWVDGKPIETRLIPSAQDDATDYQAWHVKDVRFERNQTRVIVNEYTSELGHISDGSRFFNYVLKTGRSWKGKIGEAVVTVDVSGISPCWTAKPGEMPGAVAKGSIITWRLKDFEPEKNVSVYLEGRTRIVVNSSPWMIFPATPRNAADCEAFMTPIRQMVYGQTGVTIENWDQAARVLTLRYEDRLVRLTDGSKTAIVDGTLEKDLPVAPYINRDNQFIAPIVDVVKMLGMRVTRDKDDNILIHARQEEERSSPPE